MKLKNLFTSLSDAEKLHFLISALILLVFIIGYVVGMLHSARTYENLANQKITEMYIIPDLISKGYHVINGTIYPATSPFFNISELEDTLEWQNPQPSE